jgi:hypothetical protein
MDPEKRRLLQSLTEDPGLCAACEHLQLLASKRSVFVRCGLADTDPAFLRYPPLPVRACRGYREETEGQGSANDPNPAT